MQPSSQKARRFRKPAALLASVAGVLRRDPTSTFLLLASAAILATFFALLGSLGPEAEGRRAALSTVNRLGEAKRLVSAKLLDYDHQVVVKTKTGERLYADYPGSDVATQEASARWPRPTPGSKWIRRRARKPA